MRTITPDHLGGGFGLVVLVVSVVWVVLGVWVVGVVLVSLVVWVVWIVLGVLGVWVVWVVLDSPNIQENGVPGMPTARGGRGQGDCVCPGHCSCHRWVGASLCHGPLGHGLRILICSCGAAPRSALSTTWRSHGAPHSSQWSRHTAQSIYLQFQRVCRPRCGGTAECRDGLPRGWGWRGCVRL